jgi:hypothetical protein
MDASVEVRRVVANCLLALSISFAAVLAGTMPALSADFKDPLSPLTSAEGSMLCFRRDYSPEHLAQHPKQTTKTVLLAFQQGYATIVLTPRTGAPKRIAAGCGWWEGANSAPLAASYSQISTSPRRSVAWSPCPIPTGRAATS